MKANKTEKLEKFEKAKEIKVEKPVKIDKTTKKVEEILTKVRPYIQMHGGDVSLVDVKKGIVTLNIYGACSHCSLADLTYNKLIAGLLKAEVPGIKEVRLKK